MKTDPNLACATLPEVRRRAVVHDLLAHPMIALTLYSGWAVAFHDWTSRRAWPR